MKKVKINGKAYTLVYKEYDEYDECYYYYVRETNEPFCDLDDDIEELN